MPHNRKSSRRLGGSAARVARASTLAGNFTHVGSIANLIVVERAASAWRENRLLDLFQGRRAADAGDDRAGAVEAVSVGSIRTPFISLGRELT